MDMRELRPQILMLALGALSMAFSPSAFARNTTGASAAPTNQRDIYINNYKADSSSSDDSLRSSDVYAMQALMDLSNLKLMNAVKNGYSAYGKFRNAENLDRLKDESALRANMMGSVGEGPVLPTEKTSTSFARLDPSFLSGGEAAKVSAEFERQTGMKRADFLKQIASVSEQKIKRTDPQMIDKALSRFESFLSKIPNAEFRKNAEKGIAMVPDTMRRGMVASAVTKLAGLFAAGGPSNPPIDSSITALAGDKLANGTGTATGTGAANSGATGGESEADAAAKAAADAAAKAAAAGTDPARDLAAVNASKSKNDKNGVEGVIAAALLESRNQNQGDNAAAGAEQTIFQQVTKKIRSLTPGLLKTLN